MNLQELKFIYAHPLDGNQRRQFELEGKAYPPRSEIRDIMIRWQQLWEATNQKYKVIETAKTITKRAPERNLECFVYGAGLNAMSAPFLMPTRNRKGEEWTDEYFIQTIAHEMLHILLTTNTEEYWKMVRSKYSQEELVCQNHIILYAMLFELYKKCFNTEPPDFSRDNLSPGYARAIEIVKNEDSNSLVKEYDQLVPDTSI